MTITLKPELRRFVDDQIRQGRFKSADAAIAYALRHMREHNQHVESLRRELQKGIDQLDRGEGMEWDVDEAKRRLTRRLRRQEKSLMGQIIRSPAAQCDIDDIAYGIALNNPAAARRWIDKVHRTVHMLADFPGAGPARDELAAGLRSFPVGRYLIFYRRADDGM